MNIDRTIKEISEGFLNKEIVVFCGAGISLSSGLPTVNQFVPVLLRNLGVDAHKIELLMGRNLDSLRLPFEQLIEILQENSDVNGLFDVFDAGKPNTNHLFLAKLVKAGYLKTIITTNFDHLIEDSLAMDPNPMIPLKDYDLIYRDDDFENIDWDAKRFRLIKIHGGIQDRSCMAITIKRIGARELSKKRMYVIRRIFEGGDKNKVLIMGYSSSDAFDISPELEKISQTNSKVYYLQHQMGPLSFVQDIAEQTIKNPFRKFNSSLRLFYDTDKFVEIIWREILSEKFENKTGVINWQKNIMDWGLPVSQSNRKKFNILGLIFISISEKKIASKYYEELTFLAEKENDVVGLEIALTNLGNAYDSLGAFDKAIDCLQRVLKMVKNRGDKPGECFVNKNLGDIYRKLGNYPKSFDYHLEAFRIANLYDKCPLEGPILTSLANNYFETQDCSNAIKYYEKALELARENGDKRGEGNVLSGLGNVYCALGEYGKAIKDYYEEALKITEPIGDALCKADILHNMGLVYRKCGNFTESRAKIELALSLSKEIGHKIGEARCLFNLGVLYARLNDFEKAILYYKNAIDVMVPIAGENHYLVKESKIQIQSLENNLGKNVF